MTKRLAFCFDGTWNRLDAPYPTNVVLLAEAIAAVDEHSVVQIIHYDQGVGTSRGMKWLGGLFGEGLLDIIVDAYTFLVFNYEIGDEIFVFGFSRGAFAARSFVGLLRTVGILAQTNAGAITAAVKRYQNRSPTEDHDSNALLLYRSERSVVCVDLKEDAWRVGHVAGYRTGSAPVLRIRYVGVWDTVGSLGVPNNLSITALINRQYRFYDTSLSDMVVSARHAVAIDERRRSFAATLWPNLDDLNRLLGFQPGGPAAPYCQQWFPGVHGGVGGGGDIRGLSDCALDWIVSGARNAGLALDTSPTSPLFKLEPDYKAPLNNVTQKGFSFVNFAMDHLPSAWRSPGPSRVLDLHASAVVRWRTPAAQLPGQASYRPRTLDHVAQALDQQAPLAPSAPPVQSPVVAPEPGAYYRVVRGDTLTGIAQKAYGAASKYEDIARANAAILDPDRIYVGQVVFLPPAEP